MLSSRTQTTIVPNRYCVPLLPSVHEFTAWLRVLVVRLKRSCHRTTDVVQRDSLEAAVHSCNCSKAPGVITQ